MKNELTRVMDDEAVVDIPTEVAEAGIAPVYALPTWSSAAQHLSPAAAFEPGRVDLCTVYQLGAVDHANTPTSSHLAAAVRHLAEAVNVADRGREHGPRLRDLVAQAEQELARLRREAGL